MKSPDKSRLESAFTLVEMLFVIAIILILTALLFPSFARVRENARRASCQSNMRQLGLAFMQYAQDYDSYYPCGTTPEPSAYLGLGWVYQTEPYAKSSRFLLCPSDTRQGTAARPTISYGYNNALVRRADNNNALELRPMFAFTQPSRTVLVSEVHGGSYFQDVVRNMSPVTNGIQLFGAGLGAGPKSLRMATGLFSNSPRSSHVCNNRNLDGTPYETAHFDSPGVGGANYLAADGHVKWLRPSSVSAGFYANDPDAAQLTTRAEGVDFDGEGKHQLTYSFR